MNSCHVKHNTAHEWRPRGQMFGDEFSSTQLGKETQCHPHQARDVKGRIVAYPVQGNCQEAKEAGNNNECRQSDLEPVLPHVQ